MSHTIALVYQDNEEQLFTCQDCPQSFKINIKTLKKTWVNRVNLDIQHVHAKQLTVSSQPAYNPFLGWADEHLTDNN